MVLFPPEIMKKLLDNHKLPPKERVKLKPVCKIFNPSGNGTWLLTEAYDEDRLYGLCDLGMGSPELGMVSRLELESLRGRFNMGLERDLYTNLDKGIDEYAQLAYHAGYIVA